MRTQLQLLFLFLSLIVFSCKDDEPVKPKELRPSVLTKVAPLSPWATLNHPFVYNQAGLLEELAHMTFSYNNSNLLSSIGFQHHEKEDLTYDATGKIASIHSSKGEGFPDPPYRNYRFKYDGLGRISRITFNAYSSVYLTVGLTYDQSGNVIKEDAYFSSADGETSAARYYSVEVSYDTQKNPFKGLGSPVSAIAYFTHTLPLLNVTHYLSPNNPIETVFTWYNRVPNEVIKDSFSYKYNEQGLPVEISTTVSLLRLEYALY